MRKAKIKTNPYKATDQDIINLLKLTYFRFWIQKIKNIEER